MYGSSWFAVPTASGQLGQNIVRNRMTLGQSSTDPSSDSALISSDITGSPLFVAGVTILGIAFLMSTWNAASGVAHTVSSAKRSFRRRSRDKRKKKITELQNKLRELDAF